MDIAAVGTAVGIVAAAGTVALYVIRAEVREKVAESDEKVGAVNSRIASHEAGCAVRQTALAETLKDIKEQGHRLEDKIDRLMGAGL